MNEKIASYGHKFNHLKKDGISVRKGIDVLATEKKTLKQIIECDHLKHVNMLSEDEKKRYYDATAESIYLGLLNYYDINPPASFVTNHISEFMLELKPAQLTPYTLSKTN